MKYTGWCQNDFNAHGQPRHLLRAHGDDAVVQVLDRRPPEMVERRVLGHAWPRVSLPLTCTSPLNVLKHTKQSQLIIIIEHVHNYEYQH